MQPQMQVDTATLKALIRADLDSIQRKSMLLDDRVLALEAMTTPVSHGENPFWNKVQSSPGVVAYLESLANEAKADLEMLKHQKDTLEKRLQGLDSQVVIPFGPNRGGPGGPGGPGPLVS